MLMTFDPGETTGWAVLKNDVYEVGEVDSINISTTYKLMSYHNPKVIAYENFHQRPNNHAAELYSLQVIGVIRLWCEYHDIIPVHTPLPSEAKAFWSDDKIKRLSLWTKGQRHAMDALRVLLSYRQKSDPVWFKSIVGALK